LFFFAALMFAVMLLFLWMARGYKYVSGAAEVDAAAAAAAAANAHSPHAADDECALLSADNRKSLQQV
jgi:hypothetical protein